MPENDESGGNTRPGQLFWSFIYRQLEFGKTEAILRILFECWRYEANKGIQESLRANVRYAAKEVYRIQTQDFRYAARGILISTVTNLKSIWLKPIQENIHKIARDTMWSIHNLSASASPITCSTFYVHFQIHSTSYSH